MPSTTETGGGREDDNRPLFYSLCRIVGDKQVAVNRTDAEHYCYYASLGRGQPGGVVFPADTAEASEKVRSIHQAGISFVPRGLGTDLFSVTGLLSGELVIGSSRFKRILGIDLQSRYAVIRPVVHHPPDPRLAKARTDRTRLPHIGNYRQTEPNAIFNRMEDNYGGHDKS